jgi:hypothetical protein
MQISKGQLKDDDDVVHEAGKEMYVVRYIYLEAGALATLTPSSLTPSLPESFSQ